MTTKSEYETKSNGGPASATASGSTSGAPDAGAADRSAAIGGAVSDAAGTVREAAANVKDVATTRIPEVTATTRSAIEDANRQMQSSSDEMLAMGSALSFGLAVGMLVGRTPRLLVAGALVPAIAMVLTLLNRSGWNRTTKPRSMQGG
jgi:hypothetical protein